MRVFILLYYMTVHLHLISSILFWTHLSVVFNTTSWLDKQYIIYLFQLKSGSRERMMSQLMMSQLMRSQLMRSQLMWRGDLWRSKVAGHLNLSRTVTSASVDDDITCIHFSHHSVIYLFIYSFIYWRKRCDSWWLLCSCQSCWHLPVSTLNIFNMFK